MESFPIKHDGKGFHIEGIPDAIKVIKIDNKEARDVADMTLHRHDLNFALQCLEAINTLQSPLIREALWHAAIVHFFKCFQKSRSRVLLSKDEVYSSDQTGLEIFDYFMSLRNKHLVHDENSYAQSLPGIAINNGRKDYKIEKVLCMSVIIGTLYQENFNNMKLLITKALEYVEMQADALCTILMKTLEKESYENLAAAPELTYQKPKFEDVFKARQK